MNTSHEIGYATLFPVALIRKHGWYRKRLPEKCKNTSRSHRAKVYQQLMPLVEKISTHLDAGNDTSGVEESPEVIAPPQTPSNPPPEKAMKNIRKPRKSTASGKGRSQQDIASWAASVPTLSTKSGTTSSATSRPRSTTKSKTTKSTPRSTRLKDPRSAPAPSAPEPSSSMERGTRGSHNDVEGRDNEEGGVEECNGEQKVED